MKSEVERMKVGKESDKSVIKFNRSMKFSVLFRIQSDNGSIMKIRRVSFAFSGGDLKRSQHER
jgi:hypothetical protein